MCNTTSPRHEHFLLGRTIDGMSTPTLDAIGAALATVEDPEIKKPITELGMVDSVDVSESGHVAVTILLTIAGCPL